MKYITLKNISVTKNRCEYQFDYPEEFEPYISDSNQNLFIEFPPQYNLEKIPEGILAVPFVGAILSATLLLDIGIKVPCLDQAFVESLPNIRKAFINMYPYTDFNLNIKTDLAENYSKLLTPPPNNFRPSIFFTGGLDATSALIEKIDKRPILINIFGGDLLLTDLAGRDALAKYFSQLSSKIGTDYLIIQSNCRRYFNEKNLEIRLRQFIKDEHNHGWWASIAHIIAMTTAMAPFIYDHKITTHYIGSSYTEQSGSFDANNYQMVNAIKIAQCNFELVDENFDRNAKAQKVVEYCKKNNINFQLKVCWYSKASENCSHCEKCYRTMAELISNHADPNDFGFKIDKDGYKKMHHFLKYTFVNEAFWVANQKKFLEESDFWINDKNISWLLTMDFNNTKRIRNYQYFIKLKSRLYKLKLKFEKWLRLND